jgi:hypothetical protein
MLQTFDLFVQVLNGNVGKYFFQIFQLFFMNEIYYENVFGKINHLCYCFDVKID